MAKARKRYKFVIVYSAMVYGYLQLKIPCCRILIGHSKMMAGHCKMWYCNLVIVCCKMLAEYFQTIVCCLMALMCYDEIGYYMMLYCTMVRVCCGLTVYVSPDRFHMLGVGYGRLRNCLRVAIDANPFDNAFGFSESSGPGLIGRHVSFIVRFIDLFTPFVWEFLESSGGRFQPLRLLGRGAFGEVWEAQELAGGGAGGGPAPEAPAPVVALKCSRPQGQDGLEACLLEAEVLQQLGEALAPAGGAGDAPSAGRVPRYVAHGRVHGAGHGQVLIAMSKLEGCPLDQWLYGVDESCLKALPVATLLDGPLPLGRAATRDLRSASATAEALLRQAVPVFARLAPIAFHRDVSGHNFLVHEGAGVAGREQFAILDFGLAVRSPGWQQEWRRRNIAGDPRYFTPAAWMLLTHGHRHLDGQPDRDFAGQYEHRIDHFSLGVLLCEVLFALWRGPAAEASLGEERSQALAAARAAWRAYWSRVVGFFQKFHAEGALALREAISRTGALGQLVHELGALCAALRAAERCAAEGGAERRVLQAAAGLLDWHGSLSWEGLAALLRPCE
ncbi:unnamed protein product, partial [Prorocentrum cordatum]